MKASALLLLLPFLCFQEAAGQISADSLLRREIIRILEYEGTLLTKEQRECEGENCLWQNVPWWKFWKTRDAYKNEVLACDSTLREKLVYKFAPPTFAMNQRLDLRYRYPDKAVALVGSIILPNGNLDVINQKNTSDLPVLQNGTQLSIVDPKADGTNYKLNFTSENLFKQQNETGFSVEFQKYFDLKFKANFNLDASQRYSFNLASGIFVNRLAQVFDQTMKGGLQVVDFPPIFDVWVRYSHGQISSSDSILKSFAGICYYYSRGVKSREQLEFEAKYSSELQYNVLSMSTSGNVGWSKASQMESRLELYNIYFFKKPELMSFPTPVDILKSWRNLSAGNSVMVRGVGTIPSNAPLEIPVRFGPLPGSEYIKLVKIDTSYTLNQLTPDKRFIRDIALINEDSQVTFEKGYGVFRVRMSRDDEFVRLNPGPFSATTGLRLFIDKPVIVNQDTLFLENIYPGLSLSTESSPALSLSGDMTSSVEGDSYVFKASGMFDQTGSKIVAARPRPQVVGVVDQSTRLMTEVFLKGTMLTMKTGNNFDVAIRIPKSSEIFKGILMSLDLQLLVEFKIGGDLTRRSLAISLPVPRDEQLLTMNAPQNVTIKTTEGLLELLKYDAQLPNGITIDSLYRSSKTDSGKVDYQSFIEKLRKQIGVANLSTGEYLVSAKFLDASKLK